MRIGFTGHRPNRLGINSDLLRARVGEAIDGLMAEAIAAEHTAVAISPLAEGSDRLFAEVALERGLVLEALLPMSATEYIQTFEDASTTHTFHALLRRARSVRELAGSLSDSKTAYEALGREMVEASDMLITVWDGKPAAGRGGTPEVIAEALVNARRVVWVSAVEDIAPRWLDAIEPKLMHRPLQPDR